MKRALLCAVLVSASITASTVPAIAASLDAQIVTIELGGDATTRFEVDGRRYAGPMVFTRQADGVGVTERATIEQYLEGIAEMPFSWARQALAAQAVAARTYLTRTLSGGRRGDAAAHDYDICATSRCQVYRGVQLVEGNSGDRWRRAVTSTRDELILYGGRPIEAVFTSMVGSRSRANQDVWSSDPVPYLQPVDSPEIGVAPYAEWGFELSPAQFVEILRADGLDVGGSLISLEVDDPPEGEGRTEITVVTEQGTDSILAPAMKGTFGRYADELYPGSLPARLGDGSRLPEPIMSYTYDVERVTTAPSPLDELLPADDRIGSDIVRFTGEGWGHGVGMSQWGAQIMALAGMGHRAILEHYYTGATVELAPDLVPHQVVVGLSWGRSEVEVTVDGTASLHVNGVPFGSISSGTWIVRSTRDGMVLIPAGDQPLPPPIVDRPWPR
jgi:stage II sporulation protein D (peptidoglycan lytic transglycosylase)